MSYIKEFNINDLTNCFKMSVDMEGIKKVEEYISNLQQEHKELKKQLHNASIQMQEKIEQYLECPSNCSKLEEFKTQQKEFIKYLEDEINMHEENIQIFSKNYNSYFIEINDLKASKEKLEEILSKYKEIIERN